LFAADRDCKLGTNFWVLLHLGLIGGNYGCFVYIL
jgi:hypothetical protein